ncbi:protein FAR1-RELATED SEQUENCE 6-like [Macadamia integrifolia]|uniref:protein FAR1-RELATED SEQUENCE 6-like n=1 Tax=Macadamia integrifolia TaxID=60698 RepID=UPI001C4F0A80|nr:protein FAR1-RELATED SEQUENCE 6-like [Macadamia integrifolia]
MDIASLNSESLSEDEGSESGIKRDCATPESGGQKGGTLGKELVPPFVGMEFGSYDDVYNFYNCYAKELGFGIRVKSSWFRENSKEKYAAVLCCSREGFKKKRETYNLRPETRTGCPAMLRVKLMDSEKWKVMEVSLEHNHLITRASVQFYKSHKSTGDGTKRKSRLDSEAEIQANKLLQTFALDVWNHENLSFDERDALRFLDQDVQLKIREGDAKSILNFFCRMQLKSPNFFYLMDLNNGGNLRNVFWADSRSRSAYHYFSDVVVVDTTYLANRYEIPLVAFVGVNHHGQFILVGCGLLAGETVESYYWLLKAWVTCMLGRAPSVIVTDHCRAIQRAIDVIFPTTHHHISLWHIMQKFPEKLKELCEYESIRSALDRAVYDSFRVNDFETAWGDIIHRYGIGNHEWIQMLHEDRQRWAPAYSKDVFLAGMSMTQRNESMHAFFDGLVNRQTSLKEFLDKYELAIQKKLQKEARSDFESLHFNPVLKTKCCFESQLSKVYTSEIFKKFQVEVEEMFSCFNTTQVHVDGPVTVYIVKERVDGEGGRREIRDYEVLYSAAEVEVRCICNLFNFKGYLCRHALTVLNYNGVVEIPSQYILPRWRKDLKLMRVSDYGSNNVDANSSLQWCEHLYKRAMQVLDEGLRSQEHCKVALESLEELLDKIRQL